MQFVEHRSCCRMFKNCPNRVFYFFFAFYGHFLSQFYVSAFFIPNLCLLPSSMPSCPSGCVSIYLGMCCRWISLATYSVLVLFRSLYFQASFSLLFFGAFLELHGLVNFNLMCFLSYKSKSIMIMLCTWTRVDLGVWSVSDDKWHQPVWILS